MKTLARILLPAVLTLLVLLPQAHSQQALQKKEYTGNHGNKVLVHYDPAHCILNGDTLYVIHRPTTLVLEMKPADKDWKYEPENSTLKPGEHPADPSIIPAGTEQELFPSEIASFHLTAKSTRDDIAINVVLVHVKPIPEIPGKRLFCDGEVNIPVNVRIEPVSLPWLKEHITGMELECKATNGKDCTANYRKQCPQMKKRGTDWTQWEILEALWYAEQPDTCNIIAPYRIVGELTLHNAKIKTAAEFMSVEVNTGLGQCFEGHVRLLQYFAGEPDYDIREDENNPGLYRVSLQIGSFKRWIVTEAYAKDPQGSSTTLYSPEYDTPIRTITGNPRSQFFPYIAAEEDYHCMFQYGNPSHPIMGKFFDAEKVIYETNNVINKLMNDDKIGYHNPLSARIDAEEYFKIQKENEYKKYQKSIKSKLVVCALEKEAKDAIIHQYRFTYECTYKETHGCP